MEQKVAGLTIFERALAWFEANKKQVAWGAGILVILGFIASYYFWSRAEKRVGAGEALSNVLASLPGEDRGLSADALLKVAADHPGTEAGARALLAAGGALFMEGKFAEAQAQFQAFNRDYPDNPLRGQAMFGVAACLEAEGKPEEAARAYKELIDRHPGETVVTPARFGLARIYESQNKLAEARGLYETIAREGNRMSGYNSIVNEAAVKTEELASKQPPSASVQMGSQAFPVLSTQPIAKTNAP